MSLKSLLEAVSQNATIATESESTRASIGTQLIPGSLGLTGLPSDVLSQSLRISGGADQNIQGGSSQSDRSQTTPNTLNKVPRVYGRIVSGGVITDAVQNNANSLIYCVTLSEINPGGFDYYEDIGGVKPGWQVNNVYREKDKLVFSAVTGDEHDVITLNNIADNSNADISGTNTINVYAWAGSSSAADQIFPAYPTSGAGSGSRQNAYDIMPGWTSSNTMEDLVFAIVQVNVLEAASANITSFGTFKFDHQTLGFQNYPAAADSLKNPAYALWDYLIDDRYGCGLSNVDIDTTALTSWADHCNENVQFATGTYAAPTVFTKDRFEANIYANPHSTCLTNINELCKAGQATFAYDGKQGKFTVYENRKITASEKTNAFLFNDDNIISRINVNTTDLFSLYNFSEVTYPNILERDANDTTFVQTSTADKLANEPTSGMTLTFTGVNQRSQSAAIANTTLKQSRITDVVTFTGDHSTMVVDVGDFVKLTNFEKGYTEKLFRVVRTVEENIMGVLKVKFTLAEYEDTPFDEIIYLDTVDEPFATGVGTSENYNANSSFSFFDKWVSFTPDPTTTGIYEGCFVVDNPASGSGNIVSLATGSVTGTETISNLNGYNIIGGPFSTTGESWMLVRAGLNTGGGDPAYNEVVVTLENQDGLSGSPAVTTTGSIMSAGQFNYVYSVIKLNKVTSGTYKVKVQYDYSDYTPTKQSILYTSADIVIDDRFVTGNALTNTYGPKTAVTQSSPQTTTLTNTRGYDITTVKRHDFTNVTPGNFSIETVVTPDWTTLPSYAEITFVPQVEILFANSENNETITQQHNSGGFGYISSGDILAADIKGKVQTINSQFSVDPQSYGMDRTWYPSRVNVTMVGTSYGSGNDISFGSISYTLSQRTTYWRYIDGDNTPIVGD